MNSLIKEFKNIEFETFEDRLLWLEQEEDKFMPTFKQHSLNVAKFAKRYCLFAGFSEEFSDVMYRSCRWHDIGKLLIDGNILFSSQKLSEIEMNEMKRHTEYGILLLGNDIYPSIADVVLYHHERCDGSGYLGLKSDQIPLTAKIAAVCDVFDAMTSRRTYSPGISYEDALISLSGLDDSDPRSKENLNHFDVNVLRNFVKMHLNDNIDLYHGEKLIKLKLFASSAKPHDFSEVNNKKIINIDDQNKKMKI